MAIKKPSKSGSSYLNYKKIFSIILLGISDANCRFLYCGVGVNGKASDGGVLAKSKFYQLSNQKLNIPKRRCGEMPFVFIGDAAFPLRPDLMKPFGIRNLNAKGKVFNYRLSPARRIIENSFGILVTRFRCLSNTLAHICSL